MAENVEMIRPINLPEAQQLSENDVFILDSETGGVRKIPKNKVYTPVDDTLSESGEAADAKVTGEKIAEVKAETALIQNPIGNKSGELVSFSDGADMPAISVIAHIEPIQEGEGDPSPDNVRQISGWESVNVNVTGVNLWDEEMEEGFFSTSNGEKTFNNAVLRSANMTLCKPNTDIYVKISGACSFMWYGANKEYLGCRGTVGANTVITIPDNVHYFNFGITKVYYGHDAYNHDISINYPSTDTEYHAYTGQIITKDLGQTVYGGEAEIVGGSLTDKMGMVDLGTLTWTAYGATSAYDRYITSGIDSTVKEGTVGICSHFQGSRSYSAGNIAIGSGSGKLSVFTEKGQYADAAAFKTAMNGVQFCYELATPQTYTLTPTQINTLLGENNVWADSGDVEVTYRKDINIVIDELTNAIVSLGGNV